MKNDFTGHSIIAEKQDHAGNTIVRSVWLLVIGSAMVGSLLTLWILELLK